MVCDAPFYSRISRILYRHLKSCFTRISRITVRGSYCTKCRPLVNTIFAYAPLWEPSHDVSYDWCTRKVVGVVTGDDSWIYEYDPCNKRKQWNEKHERNHAQRMRACPNRRWRPSSLNFFDCCGLIMDERMPKGQIVNDKCNLLFWSYA